MTFTKESEFEEALIQALSKKGWEKEVIKNPTEKDLLDNWSKILFDNNRDIDRLNDFPLTDGEMQQILEQINTLRTPLKLSGFINGKTVSIKRDNTGNFRSYRCDSCNDSESAKYTPKGDLQHSLPKEWHNPLLASSKARTI